MGQKREEVRAADHYTPEKGLFLSWQQEEPPEFCGRTEDTVFHLGQIYTEGPAATLKCLSCGGTQFEVGVDHCFTCIRCPQCKWEKVVHNG